MSGAPAALVAAVRQLGYSLPSPALASTWYVAPRASPTREKLKCPALALPHAASSSRASERTRDMAMAEPYNATCPAIQGETMYSRGVIPPAATADVIRTLRTAAGGKMQDVALYHSSSAPAAQP